MNVIYFGLTGEFSRLPLEALLAAGIEVRAVVMPALAPTRPQRNMPPFTLHQPMINRLLGSPAPEHSVGKGRRALPLLTPLASRSIVQVADERQIPVLEVARLRDPRTVAALATYAPDAICVACFSRRIPQELLRLPRLGCLNVHPSLLPANRGPDPLFWTFRHGDAATGVTIHLIDSGLDSGPIVAQRPIGVPDGISEVALEHECARMGGALLVEALAVLAAGTATPQPQDEARATAYPWPAAEDFVITPERSARWAYNFGRGVGERSQPIVIMTPGRTFRLIAALDYATEATQPEAYRLEGDELWLRCAPGVLHARVAAVALE